MTRQPGSDGAKVDRRTFCARALITSAGVALTANVFETAARAQTENPIVYPPMRIEGAERVVPGSFLYFNYPRRSDQAVLVRGVDGEFVAFSRKCAHLGCAIDFDAARKCLTCPCHRGTYDARTGNVVYGPPLRALDQIVLQMRAGGEVWAIGKTIAGNNMARLTRGAEESFGG